MATSLSHAFHRRSALAGWFSFVAVAMLGACGGGSSGDQARPLSSMKLSAPVISSGTATFTGNRNNYAITKTSTGYSVSDLAGSEGTSLLTDVQTIKFADFTVNPGIGDKSQTISADDLKSLVELYVAFFNRVPDADGLSYWIDQRKAGSTIAQISESFYNAAVQYAELTGYSATMSNAEFVRVIYKNVLGRTGTTAPPDADVDYWAGQLASGNTTKGGLITTMLSSAHSFQNDATWSWVPQLLDNKISVANYFAIQQGLNYNTPDASITNTMAIAAAVTSTNTANALNLVGVSDTGFSLAPVAPGAPTIGTATPANNSAIFSFTAPSSTGGASISAYTATCSSAGTSFSGTGTASPITVAGLTNGTAYNCSVTATNSAGTGTASGIVSVTPSATGNSTVPGAPAIGTGTAGNGSATLTFTAPSSTGGASISSYSATCTGGGVSFTATAATSPITVTGLTNGTAYSCSVTASNAVGSSTASSNVSVTPSATASTLTGQVYCPHSASVLNTGLNLTSTVSITCSSTQRTMSGNGVPDHTTGTFPNANNPTAIKAVTVNFRASLNPAISNSSGTSVAHVIGYANNGIKFDPATAESYQNAGVWNIEALGQTYMALGTDSSNAHVQPDGAYHYHGMPEGYITRLAKGTAMTLVGFAMDGFPIYARYGYATATDASSTLRTMTSSYRLKTTPSSGRPSTTSVPMGTFTQDYEYVADLGDLDECNGRTGVTPEFPSGIYHYYITDSYPYIQRCIKGTSLPP